MEKDESKDKSRMDSTVSGQDGDISKQHNEDQEKDSMEEQPAITPTCEVLEEEAPPGIKEDKHEDENFSEIKKSNSPPPEKLVTELNIQRQKEVEFVAEKFKAEPPNTKEDRHEDEKSFEVKKSDSPPPEKLVVESTVQKEEVESLAEKIKLEPLEIKEDLDKDENSTERKFLSSPSPEKLESESNVQGETQVESLGECTSSNSNEEDYEIRGEMGLDDADKKENGLEIDYGNSGGEKKNLEDAMYKDVAEPVFDGTEVPEIEAKRSLSTRYLESDSQTQESAWPDKASALKNFVREKSVVAVSSVLRRLSGKSDDEQDVSNEKDRNDKKVVSSSQEAEAQEVSQKSGERSGWNPLSFIGISHDADQKSRAECTEDNNNNLAESISTKGRIILYTRLGSQECKACRQFLHHKRFRYVEINIDIYPGRKLELEKFAGSSAVPRVFFNEVLIGGLSELIELDKSGKLAEKIEYIISEAPSFQAPLPPLSGEDDVSSSGSADELAVVVRKMKNSIVVKDRFYKMRRFTNCFVGSEAVDFLSEDQYLEREEAIEFGRKLASKLFIQHVLDENLFEDGNHVYRFLDDDPVISQSQNIPRGITEAKPKPIIDVSSRLRFLCYAIYEAYTSEDGKHVDYRTIHGSEEFARYLRIVEELQRVELHDMPREEKLAFFINLYNMMAIHAILIWGHPSGVLERRKLFGEFKYVIGGQTYTLSAIHNGILRGNQRPPYNLTKPFGLKDKRSKVALPYPEPLVHFALVCGTRSGPALRCYSPGNVDKELMDAAHDFLTSGGLVVDLDAKIASLSKILRWYSADFGKNEVEVLKHAANYLDPTYSQALLELLDKTQLKVVDQPYDWGLNH